MKTTKKKAAGSSKGKSVKKREGKAPESGAAKRPPKSDDGSLLRTLVERRHIGNVVATEW